MSAKPGPSWLHVTGTLLLSALTWPAAAACTPDPVTPGEQHWCFAFGGTVDADAQQPGTGDEINRISREAEGPVFERDRYALRTGIHYDSFELDEPVAANLDLYRIELRFRVQLDERTTLQLAPALATSSNRIFEHTTHDDILLQAALTRRWQQTGLLAGIVHDARLGSGLHTYPVVSWPLSLGERLQGAVGFPDAHMGLQGQRYDWTLRLGPGGYSWHVLDDDGDFRFDLRVRRWELALAATRQQQPRWFIEAGIAFARELALSTSAAQHVETRLDAALFAAVGLRLGTRGIGVQRRNP